MDIFLLILKIIGIVLLVILGLILAILLIVLLMPIRYNGSVAYADNKPDVHFRASYLFIVKAKADLKEKLTYEAKAAWITLVSSEESSNEKSDKKAKKGKQDEPKEAVKTVEAEPDNGADVNAQMTEESADAKAGTVAESTEVKTELTKAEEKALKKEEKAKAKEAKAQEKARKKALKEEKARLKAEGAGEDKQSFFDKLSEKVLHYLDIAEKAWSIVEEEEREVETFFKRKSTKYSLEKIKTVLLKLLKHIMPRKFEGSLELGLSDPAATGYVFALLATLYGPAMDAVDLTPNFKEMKIEGYMKFKGHILLGVIVYHALALYLKKKVRLFIKNAKALKETTMNNLDKIKAVTIYNTKEV